ncbi:MarR family winged helix-turn-helix transcriptional regulator [Sphaerisporangium fuscum]|uniref:MarR family winged helix-turn-helix transcriptional regulator n=1 Tax=Sphaerisporangium fuscum TaxID=2835868 RepID=UPI001BDCA839|nr:MarR family winged helix-turn-helix transcriptional regulator [Sphaerisporangium fuscum]
MTDVGREAAGLFAQAGRLVEALAARSGLEAPAFRCLTVLYRKGPLPVRRLAVLAGLDERQAAEAVEALEREGYAARRREGDDEPVFAEYGHLSGPPVAPPPGRGRVLVYANRAACRARLEPALKELRDSWHPLTAGRCDDLGVVAGLLGDGRRLTDLMIVIRPRPDAFTL